ncbi:hypothetical protein [Bacillus sp. P14.5]|uniref:hypothetical protein n=1 Tax=Bacillus sp. P14.5 TaxID=1983400 RepID=UPI001F057ECE|nr:hypothetical protein [Bacillus sp. P14.5]
MARMNVRIEKDTNEVKYISILRKTTNKSISEVKELINNNDFILSYNLLETDELLEMRKIIGLLLEAGANVQIY